MPIKRRSSMPAKDAVFDAPEEAKLNIVAKPKTPIPDESCIRQVYPQPTAQQMRAYGPLALSMGSIPSDYMTTKDTVEALRAPYDKNSPQEQRYRNRIKGRGTAITAFCVICQGGRKDVTECAATQCPLWGFRFGSDPFYGQSNK